MVRALVVVLVLVVRVSAAWAGELVLWYPSAAKHWHEALPVGNGRMGALVHGGVEREVLDLNESSVWSGHAYERAEPGVRDNLAEVRRLIFEGRRAEANALVQKTMTMKPDPRYGAYQPLGRLELKFAPAGEVSGYRRWLDLRTGVAAVTFVAGGVEYRREVLASRPDGAVVVRLTAGEPGKVSVTAGLTRGRGATTRRSSADEQEMTGQCDQGGSRFAAALKVVPTGGRVVEGGDGVRVEGADAITLVVTAATDFGGAGEPAAAARKQAETVAAKEYGAIREAAARDHGALFARVALDLGSSEFDAMATDARLARLKTREALEQDPGLVALQFQFGRYLLIASSRAGGMPANLQGIWNPEFEPPWYGDYTINVNFQMNYWPAEMCNLSELAGPMFDYIERLREPGRRVARERYGSRGIVLSTRSTPWLNTDLRGSPGLLWQEACGWLARHVWEHYLFTGDATFLRERAYPFMREAAEFYLDFLVEHPKTGLLVTGPTTSPENGYLTAQGERASADMGPAMSQQIVRELLTNTIRASELLGVDEEMRGQMRAKLARLAPDAIGSDGRLLEWSEELKEAEPGHRHNSHLYALFPGEQITVRGTPALAEASRKVLLMRRKNGAASIGWSGAWKVNCWARLEDGDEALTELHALLAKSTAPNLFGRHYRASGDVFQIDGNLGTTSGIAEMLLQSQGGEVLLLPALPRAWKAGAFSGLRARGGLEVSAAWSDGSLTRATIASVGGGPCRIRARVAFEVEVKGGAKVRAAREPDGTFVANVVVPAGSSVEVVAVR